jgi:Protein of unknown function (DUF3515)
MSATVLVGCGGPGPVHVSTPSVAGSIRAQCSRLVDALPQHVVGKDRRDVTPAGALAGAWGDPPVVLRCGVPRPAALRPTSYCFEIDHVGWLATQHGKAVSVTSPVQGTLDFTTIGRSVYVEVSVPDAYAPQADALADVAGAVAKTTRLVQPCS